MKRVFALLLITCVLLYCTGCDTYAMADRYPEDKSTVWYCKEIDFEIRYTKNEHGNLAAEVTVLEWNSETYIVSAVFHAGYFYLILDEGQEISTEDDKLVSGQWQYKDGNLVVQITDDKLFDGAFDELVFKPVPRNES